MPTDTRHKKIYGGPYLGAKLLCGDAVVVDSALPNTNFELSPCQICGMYVRTTGYGPCTDKIEELN